MGVHRCASTQVAQGAQGGGDAQVERAKVGWGAQVSGSTGLGIAQVDGCIDWVRCTDKERKSGGAKVGWDPQVGVHR